MFQQVEVFMVAADKADPAVQPPVEQVQPQPFPPVAFPQHTEVPADDEGILPAQGTGALQQIVGVAVQVPRHIQHFRPLLSVRPAPCLQGSSGQFSTVLPLRLPSRTAPGRKVFHKNRVFHQKYTI